MKILVTEQVYWQLQEALKDELDPDMIDAIKKMHPEESELILNSDAIPATDKIPDVNKNVKIDIKYIENANNALVNNFFKSLNEEFYYINLLSRKLKSIVNIIFLINGDSTPPELNSSITISNKKEFFELLSNTQYPIYDFKINKNNNTIQCVISGYVKGNKYAGRLIKMAETFIKTFENLHFIKEGLLDRKRLEQQQYNVESLKNKYEHLKDFLISNKKNISEEVDFFATIFLVGLKDDINKFKNFYFGKNKLKNLKSIGITPESVLAALFPSNRDFLKFVITDNPKMKFKMGVSPFYSTCMNYLDYNSQKYDYPLSLLSNLYDENSKVAFFIDENGGYVSRCVLRYFPKQNNEKPIIFIDNYYGEISLKDYFIELIKEEIIKNGLMPTTDTSLVKKYIFDTKKMLNRIGLKKMGSIKPPYLDSLEYEK